MVSFDTVIPYCIVKAWRILHVMEPFVEGEVQSLKLKPYKRF